MTELERLLSTRPGEVGESRDAGERIAVVSPLSVTYRVREGDRVVEVLRAGYLASRSG